jgi:hypothetical protein
MRPEYVVISERMIQELMDRSESSGLAVDGVQIRPPFSALNVRRGESRVSYPSLSEQVTETLSDQTGTPEYPGEYIGMRAHFNGWLFSFEAERTPVVWLASLDDRSLIVLCGSGRNVLGYDAPKQYPGWRPSSAGGLAEVVATLRKKDPKSLIGYQADEEKQKEMADDAAWFTSGLMAHNPGPEMRWPTRSVRPRRPWSPLLPATTSNPALPGTSFPVRSNWRLQVPIDHFSVRCWAGRRPNTNPSEHTRWKEPMTCWRATPDALGG